MQAAAQALPRFGDGAWLCELAPIRDPAGVDDAVAAVFSLPVGAGQSARGALVELLRGKYGEQRLNEASETERWRARHGGYYAGLITKMRDHGHDSQEEVFWVVRLSAEQDNLLAAWSWAIGADHVDTAFSILAGFAPCEVWNSYPLLLPGQAALQLPGATGHRRYPLALAVTALFASSRADVAGAEELCRQAAEANARQATPDWRVEETICAVRSVIATIRGAFADAARLAEQAAGLARAGGDLADASMQLSIAVLGHVLAGDDPEAVSLAREALALARQIGAPALITTGSDAVMSELCLNSASHSFDVGHQVRGGLAQRL